MERWRERIPGACAATGFMLAGAVWERLGAVAAPAGAGHLGLLFVLVGGLLALSCVASLRNAD